MPINADQAFDTALEALKCGREDEAVAPLREALVAHPTDARLWQVLGLLHRALHDLDPAVAAFTKAAGLAPRDWKIAQGLAQCRFEAGLPAVDAFRVARALAPADLSILQGLTAATASELGTRAAIAVLESELATLPRWAEGHWLMSRLLAAAGERGRACETISGAARAHPREGALWVQWASILMNLRDYAEALSVIAEARRHASAPQLDLFEAAALSEAGALKQAEAAFRSLRPPLDVAGTIYLLRHQLRMGRPDLVARLAERLPGTHGYEALYPYFSIAWRQTADARAAWLEQPELVGVYDLEMDQAALDDLAALLRRLHTQTDEPIEQSVRLGTQTDGPLLCRIEPQIQQLKARLLAALRTHLDQLPPTDPYHPELCCERDRPLRIAGSWSVRLRDAGHHEQHVHPAGWFSSAFYVALPDSMGDEASKAGWLTIGEPQQGLGPALAPTRTIEPKPGRLVLFPSTMWHGTLPFPEGERLTVAFDVARPR